MKFFIPLIVFLYFFSIKSYSQIPGEEPPAFNPDTTFIFKSPRPLLEPDIRKKDPVFGYGLSVLFSNNGFGLGGFFSYKLAHELYTFASLNISGARKTEEFETPIYYDPYYNPYSYYLRVERKKNRLFNIPFMFGVQKFFFSNKLSDNFKPFAEAGMGLSFIISTPYQEPPYDFERDMYGYVIADSLGYYYDFFESFKHAKLHIRPGGFIGIGANFESIPKSILGINIRYYYIPYGGDGLESIVKQPLKDFGGLFISLNIGVRFN